MAKFNEMIITTVGKSIYAKAIAGETIEFTKAVVGNGAPVSLEAAEALTNVVSPRLNARIDIDTTSKEGIAIVSVSVDNSTLSEDVEVRELGLFCKDPDTGNEVMYSYTYAPSTGDVIPSARNGELIWRVQLFLYIENATGSGSEQSTVAVFTPVVTPTVNGSTVFLSDVVAECSYVTDGNHQTAFYKVTGTLSNMDKAASGLTALTISMPSVSAVDCAVTGRMVVTDANGAKILVDVTGEIAKGGSTIALDYFGAQDGDFSLLATVHYII